MLTRRTPLLAALSANELRTHLRMTGEEESLLVASYLLAAQSQIENHCERALTAAKYDLILPQWPLSGNTMSKRLPFEDNRFRCVPGPVIYLEMPPILKITEIAYFDRNGDNQTVDAWDLNQDEPGELRPVHETIWPTVQSRWNAITITFWAGHAIPITLDADNDRFVSTSGYPFEDDDTLVISKSGNTNEFVGDVATLPTGVSENTTYHVVNSSNGRFQIAETAGGEAISLDAPTASGQAIDLLFAGQLDPFHRLSLLRIASRSWGERCAAGTCACGKDDFDGDPVLRQLKWRSPVDYVGEGGT